MREFLVLIGQILMIACLQTLIEVFIDPGERPYQARILNIACFAGSLYLLLQFVFTHVVGELMTVVRFPF